MQTLMLLIGTDYGYTREAIKGISTFISMDPSWQLEISPPTWEAVARLRRIKPAGVISHGLPPRWLSRPPLATLPLVTLYATKAIGNVPNVNCDHVACGRLAGQHLLDCGFGRFGFVGTEDLSQRLRLKGFREALGSAGEDLYIYEGGRNQKTVPLNWQGTQWGRDVERWLKKLPTPVALYCSIDTYAVVVLEACHALGRNVPEDVAIIGVGDDDILSRIGRPLLSGLSIPWQTIGMEAAKLLIGMIEGQKGRPQEIIVPPTGVIPRGSTDVIFSGDEDIIAAARYIRHHATNPALRVEQIARHVSLSRRSLERRFRRDVGRTVLQEVRRVRVKRAKQLLAETDLPMPIVAEKVGIRGMRYLATVFREQVGMTPTAFRAKFRPELHI